MKFEQVAPGRAEAQDGTVVELTDRHHAQLHRTEGMWLVELARGDDEDWFSVTLFRDSLLRAGGDPEPREQAEALQHIVAGLRALRVRVTIEDALRGQNGTGAHPDG